MSTKSLDEIFDLIFDSDRKLKKKYGITPEERQVLLDELLHRKKPEKYYNRLLSVYEQQAFTVEGFGYLLHHLILKSITKEKFEKIIALCVNIENITNPENYPLGYFGASEVSEAELIIQ